MAIEYIRQTTTTNQAYFNKQLLNAVNEIVNRVNINFVKITTATYTIKVDDLLVGMNVSQASAVTLPLNPPIGTNYIIKDISGNASNNNITVNAQSPNLIEGSGSTVINNNYGIRKLIYDGSSKWLNI
tara:strand:+ start:131 stop:514 length:384 start_codon:yes stop_codon:yes gene_type:complete